MALSLNHNVAAMNTYRNLSSTQGTLSKSLEKLSSGYRINRAADDAAGLAISEGLRSQINGLTQASRNAQDGINVVQTAEGALNESTSILQRLRTLAVQSANDSNDPNSRTAINAEATALTSELDRIATSTKFNGVALLDGSYNNKQFQVGYAAGDTITVGINSVGSAGAVTSFANGAASTTAAAATFTYNGVATTTAALTASSDANNIATQLNNDTNFKASYTASVDSTGGLKIQAKTASGAGTIAISGAGLAGTSSGVAAAVGTAGFSSTNLGLSGLDLSTKTGATTALGSLDTAIQSVSLARASMGAIQNRFEHTLANLGVATENLTASEASIRDTDMAKEMVQYTSRQILAQAGTAMLSQAKNLPQSVLSLLQN